MLRRAVGGEEIGQAMEHVVGPEPSRHDDGEAAARELVSTTSMRKARPSCVRSWTKSYDQTWLDVRA